MDAAKDTIANAGAAFKEDGAVGKEFTSEGSIGGTAQSVGGPFDKDGPIGQNFEADGAIGGAAQQAGEAVEDGAKKADA